MRPNELLNLKIILASGSPRRKQLLKELGLTFDVIVPDVNEDFPNTLLGAAIPEFLSSIKANAIPNDVLIGRVAIAADTIVWIDDKALNKPADRVEAISMIETLSGRTHSVYTGVTLRSCDFIKTFSDETKVTFRKLTKEEIEYYVDYFLPFDKAGAYGAQDWIGLTGIEQIHGCYFNVMGLPVRKVYHELMLLIS